jgi:hypothetical protein
LQEYCDSGTLKAFMARNEVPARVAAGDDQAVLLLVLMLRDTAKGLAALHNQAVVHGDLVRRLSFIALLFFTCCKKGFVARESLHYSDICRSAGACTRT